MSITAALAELEKSPALPDHLASLQEFLAAETLRRQKFHRDHEGRRGEFINGEIYVSPSARLEELETITRVRGRLDAFVSEHDGGEVHGGKCLVHCQRNDYEPDVCFFGAVTVATFTPDQRLFPPPDLAVEVLSPATIELDRKLKWQDYARHGVCEYWIVDPDRRMVEQYVLPPDSPEYVLRARLAEGGRLTSVVIVGFTTPVADFFRL